MRAIKMFILAHRNDDDQVLFILIETAWEELEVGDEVDRYGNGNGNKKTAPIKRQKPKLRRNKYFFADLSRISVFASH